MTKVELEREVERLKGWLLHIKDRLDGSNIHDRDSLIRTVGSLSASVEMAIGGAQPYHKQK